MALWSVTETRTVTAHVYAHRHRQNSILTVYTLILSTLP